MHTQTFIMFSGIGLTSTGSSATGSFETLGMEIFTAAFYGSGIGAPATGTITLQGRTNQNFPYVNIYSSGIVSNNTGFNYQFQGPFESLQSVLTSTTGVFSSVVLAGYHSN